MSGQLEQQKFQLVIVNDDQFAALAEGKQDFAMKMECGACVPEVGDTLLFLVPDDDPAEQGYFACDLTHVEILPAITLPTHLYKEYKQDNPDSKPDDKVAYVVFNMNPELTIEINTMAGAVEVEEDLD